VLNYPSTWSVQENISDLNAIFRSPLTDTNDKFHENVSLSVQDLSSQPMTLEQYTELSFSQFEMILTDYKLVSSEESTLGGYKAQKIVFTCTQGVFNVKYMFICAVNGNKAYLLTLTSLADSYDNYISTAEDIVKSFIIK